MNYKSALLEKINDCTAKIGVIGLGYVGLPLVVEFAESGFHVVGLDLIDEKVAKINSGRSYISDVPTEQLAPLVQSGHVKATTSYDDLTDADAIIICVPTPLRKTKDPDMSFILEAIGSIKSIRHPGMLVVLESTTYPGTTEELIMPALVDGEDMVIGESVFVAFSPERIDPGNKQFQVHNTPKVVGGITQNCGEVAAALYGTGIETVVNVSGSTTAEMVKLLENTFRAVNIGLVNEVALMCDKLGVDVWEVIQAAATKPFGFMPFFPGPGLGGHCIPVDPHYLSWKLKTLNYNARFIELASEVNTSMPYHVVDIVTNALNDDCKSVRASRIVVLGAAYKPDVDDVRESPALDIIELLREKGADVVFHDPYVPQIRMGDNIMTGATYDDALLKEADCVVIVTNHSDYDWDHVLTNSRLVIDTRNATNNHANGSARVVKL